MCDLDAHFETLGDITMTNVKMYYLNLLSNIPEDKWETMYNELIKTRQPRYLENANIDTKGNKISKSRSLDTPSSVFVKTQSKKIGGGDLRRLVSTSEISPPSVKTTQPTVTGTSGVYVTTKDAYTLTDGPTIFLSNDVEKIAKFCIQQANIPAVIMEDLMSKIEYNNAVNGKLDELETAYNELKEEVETRAKNELSSASNKDAKKLSREAEVKDDKSSKRGGGDLSRKPSGGGSNSSSGNKASTATMNSITEKMNTYRAMIKQITLNPLFIPNKREHLDKWSPTQNAKDNVNAFTSNIEDSVVCDIMALHGVEDLWKILLMMGIGVFMNHSNVAYMEIMKKMADEQKLYMIIASSDYIYGTNYQFCHGFLSKDMNLTQEKIIQAMGRVGRNNIQQTYTIRFRDDSQIMKLFSEEIDKPEVKNMNRLFTIV